MKKIFLIAGLLLLISANANAGAVKDFFSRAGYNAKAALSCGSTDVYLPFYAWHNRLFYDNKHIKKYNEEAWGFGLGRSIWDGNEWHGVYAMAFKDSNFYLETIAGYAYMYNWNLAGSDDLRAGIGYTLSLTQRHEYHYIPVPLPLPIAGISYKNAALQAAYVPGVKNDGNVLFAWLRISF